MAAIHDDTADAAIGNITGSNSTNVFLGLGLPWIIASGYYYGVVGVNFDLCVTVGEGVGVSVGAGAAKKCRRLPENDRRTALRVYFDWTSLLSDLRVRLPSS